MNIYEHLSEDDRLDALRLSIDECLSPEEALAEVLRRSFERAVGHDVHSVHVRWLNGRPGLVLS